jgi:hypothetical protein
VSNDKKKEHTKRVGKNKKGVLVVGEKTMDRTCKYDPS